MSSLLKDDSVIVFDQHAKVKRYLRRTNKKNNASYQKDDWRRFCFGCYECCGHELLCHKANIEKIQNPINYNGLLKVLVLGGPRTGKSSFVDRVLGNKVRDDYKRKDI